MADLGRLVVNLEANIARFTENMERSAQITEQTANKISGAVDFAKNALGALGIALSVDLIVSEINRSLDSLAALDDMAQKTGSSVEALSKIGKVADFTGTDLGVVDDMLVKLSKNLNTVDEKGSKAAKALAAIGISAEEIKGKDTAETFVYVTQKLQDYEDGGAKAALVTDLISKSAANMLPFMNDVAESVDKFSSYSTMAAGQAAALQDQMGLLKVRYSEWRTEIVIAALPAANAFLDALVDTKTKANDLTKNTSIDTWADQVAIGLARVADRVKLTIGLFGGLAGSVKVVAADILMSLSVTPTNIAKQIGQGKNPLDEFRAMLAEREKIIEAANENWQRLLNAPVNAIEEGTRKGITEQREEMGRAAMAAALGINSISAGKDLDYGGDDGSAAKSALQAQIADIERVYKQEQEQLARHQRAMNELRGQGLIGFEYYNEARLTAIDEASAAAVRAYDAEIKALEGARAKAKDATARDAIDLQIKDKSAAKEKALRDAQAARTQELLEQGAAQSDLTREMEAWSRQQDQAISQLQFSNDLYGKSALEVQKLTSARRAQLEVDEKIRRTQQQGAVSQEAIERFRKEAKDKADAANNAATKGVGMGLIQQLETPMESENRNHANVLRDLQAYREQELADTIAANQAIERENQRHEQVLLEMKVATQQSIVGLMSDSSSQLYSMLKQAGLEQTALGKAAFLATKALAVAQIILSTNVAAAAALAPPPIGLGPVAGLGLAGTIKALGYASAGMTAGLAIAEASAEGGYDIPAGVNPVTQLHEKEMVLPKAQAEVIRGLAANGGVGGRGALSVTYSPNFNIDSRSDRAQVQRDMQMVAQQANADLVDRLQRAGRI